MNTEFHYWLTGLIAKESGFTKDEATIIAYSSEYVDENDVEFEIKKNKKDKKPYQNKISQTMNILRPMENLLKIYPLFHFIPGEPDSETAVRHDGKMHLLNTTPNSGNANEILDSAFKSSSDARLYRIGIATHAYVDTWAHQNFVGANDSFNNIGLDPKPNIGHADAESHPDYISHRWEDQRLINSTVNNRERFLLAAHALFMRYVEYLKTQGREDRKSRWPELERILINLMGPTYTGSKNRYADARMQKYLEQIDWLAEFDQRLWFDRAINTDVNGFLEDSHDELKRKAYVFRDDYYWKPDQDHTETHWFRFQEAVKEHQNTASKILSSTFAKINIDIINLDR